MTQEEKAKAYEMALEAARKELGVDRKEWEVVQRVLHNIFPELAEGEDEKIRKALIDMIKRETGFTGFPSQGQVLAYLEKQKEPEDKGEISDGYHTFNELYYYRMLYNAAFFNLLPKEWVHKSKKHHDGEECFGGGWFVVIANLPTGQISNHYELKDWDLFQIPEKEIADKWDGHTPQEAAERLYKYLQEKQKKQKPVDLIKGVNGIPCPSGKQIVDVSSSEWSEEDEKMLKSITNDLFCGTDFNMELKFTASKKVNWLKDKLKSFRPSWKPNEQKEQKLNKWSKKDKKILQSLHHVMNCADAQNVVKRDGLSVEDVCTFLFSIEPN